MYIIIGFFTKSNLRDVIDIIKNITYTVNENKATDRRLALKNMDYKRVTAILSGPAVTFLCDLLKQLTRK